MKSEISANASSVKSLGRLDFTYEVLEADEASRRMTLRLTPNPKRYQEELIDGERHYVDRFLGDVVPAALFMKMMAENLPIYSLTPRIASTLDYSAERTAAITDELAGLPLADPSTPPASHVKLEPTNQSRQVVFVSVDICGSTKLRKLDAESYDHACHIFLREVCILVGQFNGSILKTTGDGLIAFIDHPSFTRRCDNAVDMATSIITFVRSAVNPALKAANLPAFQIRVGADHGDALVRQLHVEQTGFATNEIYSDCLNRAVKLQELAGMGELWIGHDLYKLLHTDWLARGVRLPAELTNQVFGEYAVYRIS